MDEEIVYLNNKLFPDHVLVVTHEASDVEAVYVVPKQWFKDHDFSPAFLQKMWEEADYLDDDPSEYTPQQHKYRKILDELRQFPQLEAYSISLY